MCGVSTQRDCVWPPSPREGRGTLGPPLCPHVSGRGGGLGGSVLLSLGQRAWAERSDWDLPLCWPSENLLVSLSLELSKTLGWEESPSLGLKTSFWSNFRKVQMCSGERQ